MLLIEMIVISVFMASFADCLKSASIIILITAVVSMCSTSTLSDL